MSCTFDPQLRTGGMFHCPGCGEMVVAGIPHPYYSLLRPPVDDWQCTHRAQIFDLYDNPFWFLEDFDDLIDNAEVIDGDS